MSALSRIAADWCRRCFPVQAGNIPERALRTVEEAIEFCQATGVPKDKVLLATETVYSRPVGEPIQELGGTLLTSYIAAELLGWEPDDVVEKELTRVLAKPVAHFVRRNQEKDSMGLLITRSPAAWNKGRTV